MRKDYYAVLGIKPGASDKEIRSAYKRLARKFHPDVNPDDRKAAEKFREITEAYEVLGDPEKRRSWEQGDFDFESFFQGRGGTAGGGRGRSGGRRGATRPGSGPRPGMGGFGSILDEMMRGMGGSTFEGGWAGGGVHAAHGADLQTEATLSFEESVAGAALTLPLARTVTCPDCRGTGTARAGKRAACASCQGAGTRRVSETIQVRIPPGVEAGARVRVAGKGEAGEAGAPPGDLYVVISVAPHPWFRREGSDVLLDLPLSFQEAALGARVEVPTLAGKVALTVPAASRSGQRLRLRGRGVPGRDGRAAGDQIVTLQIVSPQRLDDAGRRLLEELDRLSPVNPRADLGW